MVGESEWEKLAHRWLGPRHVHPCGARLGFSDRFESVDVLSSYAQIEAGFSVFNAQGSTFTFFARRELYRDAGITSIPAPADILLVGIRLGDSRGIW